MRLPTKYTTWIALLVLVILLTGVAAAADPAPVIVRHVAASAGQQVEAGSFILSATLGEPVAGPFVTAGGYQVASGFWRVLAQKTRLFLPMVVRD